jgi:predicted metal-dependent phosphoesterase TrpH
VPHRWAALGDAVGWIRAAGGIAVIAHPGRYRLPGAEAERLVAEFREVGGGAIEIATGSHEPAQAQAYARLARAFGLAASRGSDFHAPGEGAEPGRGPSLAPSLEPVWAQIDLDRGRARAAAGCA